MKSLPPYLDRSSPPWIGAVCVLLLAGCEPAREFRCSQDADCVLSGEQGICLSTAHCAYPKASCPSGYAYPEGAGESLAGVCLPPGIATGTGGPQGGTGASSGTGSSGGSD